MSAQNFKNWETPRYILDVVVAALGIERFHIDVAASIANAKASTYIDEEMNGLASSWNPQNLKTNYAWCNPPYQNIGAWVDKAMEEAFENVNTVMLLPSSTDTKWFHKLRRYDCGIGFVQGRIKFYDPRERKYGGSPAHANLFACVGAKSAFRIMAPEIADAVSEAIKRSPSSSK